VYYYAGKAYSSKKHKPFSPSAKAASDAALAERLNPMVREGGQGITKCRMTVCPARMFKHHPDKDLRRLANKQAREQHKMWGPCAKWLEPRTRRMRSANPHEAKPGLRPFLPRTIQYGCLGASEM
jgi:hypothetical protein